MKNQEISYFHKDNAESDKEINKLISLFDGRLRKGDGRVVDLYFDDKTVEIKTESRFINETGNVAYEYYSNIYAKTIGGPWKSYEDGIEQFWSYFPKSNIVVCCEVNKLVPYLNSLLENGKLSTSKFHFYKKNEGRSGDIYTTTGWVVSIKKLFENDIAKGINLNKST